MESSGSPLIRECQPPLLFDAFCGSYREGAKRTGIRLDNISQRRPDGARLGDERRHLSLTLGPCATMCVLIIEFYLYCSRYNFELRSENVGDEVQHIWRTLSNAHLIHVHLAQEKINSCFLTIIAD